MDSVKKESSKRCGPGGYKCRCCGPSPKGRKLHRRWIRHCCDQQTAKEIESELEASAPMTERKSND